MRAIYFMFRLVGMSTKLVNWNKEPWLSSVLPVVLSENDLEIIQVIVGRCRAVNLAPKF